MNAAKRNHEKRLGMGAFLLVLALIAALIYVLNRHTPLMMDDYDYSFSWATGKPLAGVSDVILSQIEHYKLWGGRSVTHTLAQMFLYWGKGAFNVVNTLMYLCLLLEIYALARRQDDAWDWRLLLLAHGALFFLVPFFGVAFLWLDGACNYLFGTVLALLPLLIARSEREGGFFDAGIRRGVLALPVCFIAGWTNENTACGVLAVMILLLVCDRLQGRRIRCWRIAAAALEALGVALMLLAPGNFARSGGEAARGMLMELVYRFAVVSYCVLRYAGVMIVLALLAVVLARRRKAPLRFAWFFVLCAAAFLCAYALIGSPQISDRSFTGVIVLVLSAALSVYTDLPRGRFGRAALLVVALAAVIGGYKAVGDVSVHEAAWNAQLARIEEAREKGEARVIIESVPSVSPYTFAIAIEKEPDAWPNSTLGKYFGIEIAGGE